MRGTKSQTERQLRIQLKQVQSRLAESEAALKAIRGGEVDAIVVDGPQGSQVFSLQGPEEPYRILAERMNEGAATLTAEGTILFCNPRLAEMVGLSAERLLGSSLISMLRDGAQENFPELVRQAFKKDVRAEAHLLRSDGTMLPVQLSLSSIPLEDSEQGICVVATDLSDQKRAEQKIREQAALLDLAQDAVLFRGLDGRILFWNRGARDLYGWTAEEAVGKISHDLLQTKLPEPLEKIEVVIQETREWEGELKHISREGKVLVVMSRWSLLRDEQGKPTAILEIDRDITERKRAQESLRLAHERLRRLIDSNVIGIVIATAAGDVVEANDYYLRLVGFSREELEQGQVDWRTVTPPEWVPADEHAIRELRERGSCTPYEKEYLRRDGSRVPIFLADTLLPEPEEQIAAFVVDVTKRKQAEEALKKASQYARSLIEASLDPLVTINREGKITDVNEATEGVTGVARDQLIGTDFLNYFTEPEIAQQGCQRAFAEGSVRDYPLAIRHASGQVTDVLYNANVFRNEAGEVEGVFAAARDVTERKRAEEEVRKLNEQLEQRVASRTEELRGVNKELEAFNYAVAHDLRAPLRHIHGFAEMLAEEASPVLSDSSKHHLDTIRDSVEHMSQLLEDLLKLSRLGRQELSKQVCGLKPLVEEVVKGLQPETQDRQVEWRIADLPFVQGDPVLLKQVLVNLLSNALKFTRSRQPAIIEIGQTTIDAEPVVFVRDNGVGFSMKYADKLFGLFQRLHRQQDFEGTGVGLAIVQRIIHRHGGRVWAEAELNKGATFYLSLHACEAEKKELATATAAV